MSSQADQLFAEAEGRVKHLICHTVTNECNNCFIIRSPCLFSYFSHFLAAQGGDLPFFSPERGSITREQSIICSKARLNGTMYELTILCRSRGGLSASGKEEHNASNENNYLLKLRSSIVRNPYRLRGSNDVKEFSILS